MRDYVRIARQYADAVVEGRRVAGQLEIAACARFLADLDRAAAGWDYYLDAEDAAHICAFSEELPHVEGDLAGKRIHLADWQVFEKVNLNGWRDRTGRRRFRTSYTEVARKNGKSTGVAPDALFLMTADGEPGAKVYTAATKMAQARLVFDVARRMAQGTPDLIAQTGLVVQKHRIFTDDSEMKPLEAKTLDGLNPHGAIIDELHQHKNRDVYDALNDALGARSNPLLRTITTAGQNLAHVCYEQHDRTRCVLLGQVEAEAHFGLIYAIDPDDDPFDEAVWPKANPNLGISKRIEYMRERAAEARMNPSSRGEFLRKQLGVWTSEGASAFDHAGFARGKREDMRRERFRDAGGLLGLDLSDTDDLTCIAWLRRDDDGGFTVFCDHFATERCVDMPGRETLRAWADAGHIEVHSGSQMDLDRVEAVAEERAMFHGVERVAVDPYLGRQLMRHLEDAGLPVVEMKQTPMNLSAPFHRLINAVSDGMVRHSGDPVLEWAVRNTVAVRRTEWSRPEKLGQVPRNKIDPVQAMITAAAAMDVETEPEAQSYLASEGMLVL